MAPPTKTRACAFAGRAGPRRRSAPSRAAAAITPARRQSLPPAFTRGRNTRAVSQLRGRTAVEGSRTPTPSRAEDVDLRDTDHGEPKEPREIKAASRTPWLHRWAIRILGVLSASTSTSNRVLSQLVLVAGVQTSGVSCVGSLPIAWGDLPRRFLRVGASS